MQLAARCRRFVFTVIVLEYADRRRYFAYPAKFCLLDGAVFAFGDSGSNWSLPSACSSCDCRTCWLLRLLAPPVIGELLIATVSSLLRGFRDLLVATVLWGLAGCYRLFAFPGSQGLAGCYRLFAAPGIRGFAGPSLRSSLDPET